MDISFPDTDAALASYTKAIEAEPRYVAAYYGRGLVYQAKGDNDAALADLTKAVEMFPAAAPGKYYYARGRTQLDRRDYDAAIGDFSKAVAGDAYFADAYYGRGLARHRKGEHDAAIADYDRAVEIVPPAVPACGMRGRVKLA